jgi:hypothetical protein
LTIINGAHGSFARFDLTAVDPLTPVKACAERPNQPADMYDLIDFAAGRGSSYGGKCRHGQDQEGGSRCNRRMTSNARPALRSDDLVPVARRSHSRGQRFDRE